MDSDDWIEPDYLECLYNEAERTGADVVGCNLVREYEKSLVVKNQISLHPKECIRGLLEGEIQGWFQVKVLAPSWADEFITGIKSIFPNKISYLNTDNESVVASLKFVLN